MSCAWTQALLFLDGKLRHSAAQCTAGGHRSCGPWLLCSETQGFFCLEQVAVCMCHLELNRSSLSCNPQRPGTPPSPFPLPSLGASR